MMPPYDIGLVLLSAGVVFLGCFTGLVLLTNLLKADPAEVGLRLVGAATAMGGGLWAMQFIGLLAMKQPDVKLNFDVKLTAFSAVVILLFTALSVSLTRAAGARGRTPLAGPLMMGGAVAAMHFIGLQALRGPFALHFSWPSEAGASALAVAASWLWLWLAIQKRGLVLTVVGTLAVSLTFVATHYGSLYTIAFLPARPLPGWTMQTFSEARMAWSAAVVVYLACSLGICMFMILQFRGDFLRQNRERTTRGRRPGAAMAFSPGPFRARAIEPELLRQSGSYGYGAQTGEPSTAPTRETLPPAQYQVPARIDAPSSLPAPLRPLDKGELTTLIAATSAGTVFAWYDFYLYAILAKFFATRFFPPEHETAALLGAFAAYAAGFIVRPLGALIFGRAGDLYGRKYTFLVTITIMGFATFSVGLLPTFAEIGWVAPVLLLVLRLLQGLALGGEYGGAATYVAEAAWQNRRGYATAWIQSTATVGFLLSLAAVGLCRVLMGEEVFTEKGWRLPFLLSLILLILSVVFRLRLKESRIFDKLLADGKESLTPLRDSFLRAPNAKLVWLALFGAAAGQGVVWYTGHFHALYFLTITMKLDYITAYEMIGLAALAATPFFIFFGWLSDKIGRLKIILAGCLLAAFTYFPLFHMLAEAVNPALAQFQRTTPVVLHADPATCNFHIFKGPWSKLSECDVARDFLTNRGAMFQFEAGAPSDPVSLTVGDVSGGPWDAKIWEYALTVAEFPEVADLNRVDYLTMEAILFFLMLYVAMVYGPIAAFLTELFPTNIRYTSMSLPYHIGNGWFGGILPLLATALTAATGDIYAGLWYPVIVAAMTFVIGGIFLKDQRTRPMWE
jgi:NO-binding membrane sensor protein with MHYT domain